MAVIGSGATPLALPGGMSQVHSDKPASQPLDNDIPKPPARKPPKPKKRAFGPSSYGAAFKK